MLLLDFLGVLYEETPIEICIDFEPQYKGLVMDVPSEAFRNSRVLEAYISVDDKTLVVSITNRR